MNSKLYKIKYLKYKQKYIHLKNQLGGECTNISGVSTPPGPDEVDFGTFNPLSELNPNKRISINGRCASIESYFKMFNAQDIKGEPFRDLNNIPISLNDIQDVIFTAVRQEPLILLEASPTIVNLVVHQNGLALQFASYYLRNNYVIVMTAVQQNGLALQFASYYLQNNYAIVMAAVQQNGLALEFATYELQNNYYIVMAAVQQNGLALQYSQHLSQDNIDIIFAAVRQNELALQFTSIDFQNWWNNDFQNDDDDNDDNYDNDDNDDNKSYDSFSEMPIHYR